MTQYDRLMEKLEKQIRKGTPKAYATLARLIENQRVVASGVKMAVGPFRQAPVFTVGALDDSAVYDYWDDVEKRIRAERETTFSEARNGEAK